MSNPVYTIYNDNRRLDYVHCGRKDVLRDVGHQHLGVIFICPWPEFNGEIHSVETNKNLVETPSEYETNYRYFA